MSEPNGWEECRLGDLLRITHGWAFKGELMSEELTGRPIVVNIGNYEYTGGFRFESTRTREYTGDYPAEYELSPGDILLAMTCQTAGGEILGIPGQVPDDGRTYLHNQRLGKVVLTDPNRICSDFAYYVFLWSVFNQHLCATATGTKILHTAPNRIEDFRLSLPPMHEQRGIAHILRSLDDKAHLNRRMNETLEAMASATFRSWFVDFDPVRAKGEGRQPTGMDAGIAAVFPDGFETTQLGEVPKGWESQPLANVIELVGGGTPKTSIAEYWDGEIPWFSVVDAPRPEDVWVVDTQRKITERGLSSSSAVLLPVETTIISARGTVGRVALVGSEMAMNQSCYAVLGKPGYGSFFMYYRVRESVASLQRATHGTVFDTITRDTFNSVHVPVPPPALSAAFSNHVSPMMELILRNLRESLVLAEMRDTLLPKLMSGELRAGQLSEDLGGDR